MQQGDSADRILDDLTREVSEWEQFRSLLERFRPPPAVTAPAGQTPPANRTAGVQGKPAAARFCTRCGRRLTGSERFCNACGTGVATAAPTAAAPRFCTGCGQPADVVGRFCQRCGTKIG